MPAIAIGQIHRRKNGFPVGKAVDGGKTGDPLDDGPEAGALAVGPVLTPPEIRMITSFGLSSSNVSGPSPIFSSTPGRKLSMNRSEAERAP